MCDCFVAPASHMPVLVLCFVPSIELSALNIPLRSNFWIIYSIKCWSSKVGPSRIGNVSKSTGILILNGENDSQTPIQQAFLLQQRLTEVNHPDHTLITYQTSGIFFPSNEWTTFFGPIQQYVLADIYSWLEAHSGFTCVPTSISSSSFYSSSFNSTTK